MILLLTGASHTGKTNLAQQLMERYQFPYLSIDLLKMGLIRSKQTNLTPQDDEALEDYLWPIVKEIIKTAIENQQNLIVEGCHIPFTWANDFEDSYRDHLRFYCLILSESYIQQHFKTIKDYANVIEKRIDDSWCTQEMLLQDNQRNLALCQRHNYPHILIEELYSLDLTIFDSVLISP